MPSQISFCGSYIHISDCTITFLLQMLVQSLPATENDDWVRRVRDKWRSRLTGCGFGLYELDLEELVTNEQERQRMLQVFDFAKRAINANGPCLTLEWLNSLPGQACIYTRDQEASSFVEKLDQIATLLRDGAGPGILKATC